ncbi:MAG: hypothetical protein WCT49_01185 [Candidatus Paceibacterota bacterium]
MKRKQHNDSPSGFRIAGMAKKERNITLINYYLITNRPVQFDSGGFVYLTDSIDLCRSLKIFPS